MKLPREPKIHSFAPNFVAYLSVYTLKLQKSIFCNLAEQAQGSVKYL